MHEVLVNCLFKVAQEKSVVRSSDRPAMTIAVGLKQQNKQTNKNTYIQVNTQRSKRICRRAKTRHIPVGLYITFKEWRTRNRLLGYKCKHPVGILNKSHYRAISERPIEWRFVNGPIVA